MIAQVGSIDVYDTTYQDRLSAAVSALTQAGAPSPMPAAMQLQIETSIVQSLVLDAVMRQMAQRAGVLPTQAQVQAALQQQIQAGGGTSSVESQLAAAGGSMPQLKDEVAVTLTEQDLENYEAQQRAAQVEKLLAQGASFSSVATQYSDDPKSQPHGGDLGVVTLAQLDQIDPALRHVAVSLKAGQYTTTPIRDTEGYDIIRSLGTTATGIHLQRILIAAYQPYTVQNRPAWFSRMVLQQLGTLCSQNQVQVFIRPDSAPCTPETPIPSAAPTPTATP